MGRQAGTAGREETGPFGVCGDVQQGDSARPGSQKPPFVAAGRAVWGCLLQGRSGLGIE